LTLTSQFNKTEKQYKLQLPVLITSKAISRYKIRRRRRRRKGQRKGKHTA
jgi:hypothetical protein